MGMGGIWKGRSEQPYFLPLHPLNPSQSFTEWKEKAEKQLELQLVMKRDFDSNTLLLSKSETEGADLETTGVHMHPRLARPQPSSLPVPCLWG